MGALQGVPCRRGLSSDLSHRRYGRPKRIDLLRPGRHARGTVRMTGEKGVMPVSESQVQAGCSIWPNEHRTHPRAKEGLPPECYTLRVSGTRPVHLRRERGDAHVVLGSVLGESLWASVSRWRLSTTSRSLTGASSQGGRALSATSSGSLPACRSPHASKTVSAGILTPSLRRPCASALHSASSSILPVRTEPLHDHALECAATTS